MTFKRIKYWYEYQNPYHELFYLWFEARGLDSGARTTATGSATSSEKTTETLSGDSEETPSGDSGETPSGDPGGETQQHITRANS